MNRIKLAINIITLAALFVAGSPAQALRAQATQGEQPQQAPPQQISPNKQTRSRSVSGANAEKGAQEAGVPAEILANRHEEMSEEQAALLPYYNNFLSSYRLGPEDVISITVFNQDRYSKAGITIPPDGRIAVPLIPDGLFVVGKTTQQVAEEISKRYDEYIIDPKVSVSLDKAMSTRYFVIGDVAQPGAKVMTHRLTVTEALSEAGGILRTGNKKKVVVLRRQADGTLQPILVNVAAIERGRVPDNIYLAPGDQVAVPGNRFKSIQDLLGFLPILSFARIFALGY